MDEFIKFGSFDPVPLIKFKPLFIKFGSFEPVPLTKLPLSFTEKIK